MYSLPVKNWHNIGQPRGHKPYDLLSEFSRQLSREAKLCVVVRPDLKGEASDSPAREHFRTVLIKIRATNTNLSLFIPLWVGRDNSVGIATRYERDDPRIESRWGWHFPYPSRMALGPTRRPVQWVAGAFPGDKFGRGVTTSHTNLAPRLKKEDSYTSTAHLGLHGLF